MQVRVKKLNANASMPIYATNGSACFDLVACTDKAITVNPRSKENIGTGLAFEIPANHVMLVFSRSGHGFKHDLRFVNCVGVIDSDYRGEVRVGLRNDGISPYIVQPNERIAQAIILPYPSIQLVESDELSDTERGVNGFGSTGKN